MKQIRSVRAGGTTAERGARRTTGDSFQNFLGSVGVGTQNLSSGGTYGFNPITRNHVLLEWCYRGSWIIRKAVDCPAEDMTRQGVTLTDDMQPQRIEQMQTFWRDRAIWTRLTETVKWSRLYGGAVAVVVIDGQKFEDPLRIRTVGRGQFRGLIVLDRWMVQPDFTDLVSDPGPNYGQPRYYSVVADAQVLPFMRVHHSRCVRLDGIELPYWQRLAENGWGLSIVEPVWDRLIAFDSATQGVAQLVYKAYIRRLKLPKLREAIATGGRTYNAIVKQVNAIRLFESIEGITMLDAEDTMETSQYAFSGLPEVIDRFAMQLSGGFDVPLTRMFGQSPGGLNSTGDSDIRNYYDGLKSRQENELRSPVHFLFELTHRSLFGENLPNGFGFTFNSLWQLTEPDKATITGQTVVAVIQALEANVIDAVTAAKELRTLSRVTGVFSNITDAYLRDLVNHPPEPELGEPPGPDEEPGGSQPNPTELPTGQDEPVGAGVGEGEGGGAPSDAEEGDAVGSVSGPATRFAGLTRGHLAAAGREPAPPRPRQTVEVNVPSRSGSRIEVHVPAFRLASAAELRHEKVRAFLGQVRARRSAGVAGPDRVS